jgi:predicted CoA-substrate-specific enzyme activase
MTGGKLGIGVDIGSTTTKAVLVDHTGSILATYLINTGATAEAAGAKVIEEVCNLARVSPDDASIIGTGYGRALVESADKKVTEITCHSVGVHQLNPEIQLLIDVGGQDSKVIKIGPKGRPEDFEINDKCSAGTGRFLEVMARVLEVSMDESMRYQ